MQMPLIAAITGFRLLSATRITVCSVGSALDFGVLNSRMSAPPENALPLPTMTIASQLASVFARSIPATTSLRVSCPSAFTGGLSSVMTATRPFSAYCAPMIASNSDFQPFLAYRAIVAQIGSAAFEDDASLAHHVQPVRNSQGDRELLLDQQDRHAARGDLQEQPAHLVHEQWGETLGRLVDHDEIGIAPQIGRAHV